MLSLKHLSVLAAKAASLPILTNHGKDLAPQLAQGLLNLLVSLACTPVNQRRDLMEKHNLAVWFGQLYAYSEQLFPKIMLLMDNSHAN
jgi:hypothetical protein